MFHSITNFLWLFIVPIFTFIPVNPAFHGGPHKKKIIKWAVQKTSSIQIQGSTNINSFGCDITGYYQQDTIFCSEGNEANQPVALNGALQINLLKFDCHSKMLTGDLRKTLKVSEYPNLVIRFLSLARTPVIQNSKDCLKGWVEIDLAGITRKFEINYSFVKAASACIRLNGNQCFSFADFNLTPPRKFGGLIKVKDKFNVDFNLLLTPVE